MLALQVYPLKNSSLTTLRSCFQLSWNDSGSESTLDS